MKLFRKDISQTKSSLNDKAAGWIADGILKTQKTFANILGKTSNSWKAKQQWIFLYLVCLVFGGVSIITIAQPFNKKAQIIFIKPTAIKTPINIHSNQDLHSVIITANEINQVHKFKHMLDSLSATNEGRIKVNQFLNQRPGLLDSLEMVEQLYYLQKNKR